MDTSAGLTFETLSEATQARFCSDAPGPSFAKLPEELRNRIYKYVVVQDGDYSIKNRSDLRGLFKVDKAISTQFNVLHLPSRNVTHFGDMALEAFYASNTFAVAPHLLPRFLNFNTTGRCSPQMLVRHLVVDVDFATPASPRYDFAWGLGYAADCTRLQRAEVRLHGPMAVDVERETLRQIIRLWPVLSELKDMLNGGLRVFIDRPIPGYRYDEEQLHSPLHCYYMEVTWMWAKPSPVTQANFRSGQPTWMEELHVLMLEEKFNEETNLISRKMRRTRYKNAKVMKWLSDTGCFARGQD